MPKPRICKVGWIAMQPGLPWCTSQSSFIVGPIAASVSQIAECSCHVCRRLPPPFVEEELRRGSLDFYDRPDAYPGMMLPNGYPPHLRAIPGDVRGRSVHYLPPSLPPHADPYHPGPGPLHDRGPPPGGFDHRRYRSVSPPAHLRGMPAWASPPDRDALPPARVVRHHDGPAWPSRPPSPGPLPRGFDPGRRPSDSLDHSLPPHYRQDPSRGYPRQYLSPPREYAARPPSGQDPRPDLMARGRRPLSPSPPRRPQHPAHHAPLGRYPAADGYGRGEWEPPRQGGLGLAPLRHSSGSLPHRPQQSPPPPMRMPPAQDRLERRGARPLPFGGHPRDISPPRDAAYRDALAGPSGRGYGEAGLAPLRHIERWDSAPSRPGFQESSRLPPHMLDRFDGPRYALDAAMGFLPWPPKVLSYAALSCISMGWFEFSRIRFYSSLTQSSLQQPLEVSFKITAWASKAGCWCSTEIYTMSTHAWPALSYAVEVLCHGALRTSFFKCHQVVRSILPFCCSSRCKPQRSLILTCIAHRPAHSQQLMWSVFVFLQRIADTF